MCRRIIALAAVLVPRWRRAEWREEWESEVDHAARVLEVAGGGRGDVARLAVRCLGALPHAAHLRVADWSVEMIVQDMRYALRGLARRPLFTLVAGGTLALGIGANATIFAVVNAVLLKPLPYGDPERLVWVKSVFSGGDQASVSPPDFLDYREQTRVFEAFSAMQFGRPVTWTGGEVPEELQAGSVTADYLRMLGLSPVIGRWFEASEERVAQASVVVISERLWRSRFEGSREVLGRTLLLDGVPHTVVGVFPATLGLPGGRDVLMPIAFEGPGFDMRAAHFLRPIARLREGVSLEAAQADVDIVARRLEQAYPTSNTTWRLRLVPLQEQLVGGARPALLILLGAVGAVLLIACVNVANLVLASASTRSGEFAVRTVLGASRMRLARQLVIETVLLALGAGAAAVLFALAAVEGIRTFGPATIPRLEEVTLDGTVLGYAFGVALIVGVAFGTTPLLQRSGRSLADTLRGMGRGGTGRGQRMRSGLVVAEIALSSLLVVSAALLIRSFTRLTGIDPGFDAESVLVARIQYPEGHYGEAGRKTSTQQRIEERLRALPGVEAVGATNAIPLAQFAGDTRAYAAKRPPMGDAWVGAQVRVITPGYFAAMGIPLIRGRAFEGADRGGAEHVAILNDAMAAEFFPGEDPVGEILMVGLGEPVATRIVGVVGGVRQFALGLPPAPEFYLPLAQAEGAGDRMTTVVRARGEAVALASAVAATVREIDPDQPLSMLEPLTSVLAGTVTQPRFQMFALGAFAVLALVLAAIGVYGVLAFSVVQRQREIGIRIALGARRAAVIGRVIGQGMALALLGLVIGLGAAAGMTRVLRTALYEIGPLDATAFAMAPATLAAVALLASWIPARRAARVDPATVLRE
jgi:putative ABC transport system permease protein